jgi:hypothetical protein
MNANAKPETLPGEVAWWSMLRTPRAKDFTGQGKWPQKGAKERIIKIENRKS